MLPTLHCKGGGQIIYLRRLAGKCSSSQSNMRYLVAFTIKAETTFHYLEEDTGDVFSFAGDDASSGM